MKVLVLGGNRFFGKRLVQLLIDRGDEVTVLNRGSRDDGFGDRIRRVRCDRNDARDLVRAVGSHTWDVIYDQVCYDAATAEAASRIFLGKVGRYVFTSSKSVYECGADLREIDFDPSRHSFAHRETYTSNYSEAKRQAEAAFFQARAFPVTAVRFPVVFGPDDYTGRLKFHVDRVATQTPIYVPNLAARNCFVHAADAAATLLRLSEIEAHGPLNVCSPDPIEIGQLLAWVEESVEARAIVVSRPELGETSPIAVPADWYMNTDRLASLGIRLPALRDWLPALIRQSVAGS
jgi:nucleoside-diphosphate-sugar epimerase